jgi:hypothetical protein
MSTSLTSTLEPLSWFSEAEKEAYEKRLADKSQPYYYGYDIKKDANEIVYPVLFDTRNKPITLNEARGRGLLLYPKRNVYIMNKIRSMVIGMENWSIGSIYAGIRPLTEANDDTTTINFILEDLEKEKRVVRVYDAAAEGNSIYHPSVTTLSSSMVVPETTSYQYTYETPPKEYSKINFKWYTMERAERDGVLEIRCKAGHCSKVFKTYNQMNNHFNSTHISRTR